MNHPSVFQPTASPPLPTAAPTWAGLLLVAFIATISVTLARFPFIKQTGCGALTLAILLGIAIGNSVYPALSGRAHRGVDFSRTFLLRVGIVLYGFRITFQQIAEVGWTGALIDALMLGSTFLIAYQLGIKVFKMDRDTVLLIGAGSSICGAAAVMATEPVVRADTHKVSVAIATVVIFGTISMFAYPLLYPLMHLSEHAYGIYVGSSVHEVAQVVVAGKSISDAAANTAVIEKLLRVMMLAPFLMLLSMALRREEMRADPGCAALAGSWHERAACALRAIPWFALLFVVVSVLNSTNVLPARWVNALIDIDTILLTMAMAALGLRTRIDAVRQAGVKPILLAASLFVFLTVGGYAINWLVMKLLA